MNAFDALDEGNEAFRLKSKSLGNIGVCDRAWFVQSLVDGGNKNAEGKEVGIAIAENLLQLFHWTESAPSTCRQADKTNGALLKTFGKF